MKRKLLSLVVAGSLATPIMASADVNFDANVDFYGSIRAGVNKFDGDDAQVTDELSRLGVKGDVDFGVDNVTGIFQYEGRLKADTGEFAGSGESLARLAYAGAKGSWGQATIGRIWLPGSLWTHMAATGAFNDVDVADEHNVHHRMPNTISYMTPDFGGFQAAATAVLGGSGGRIGDSIFGTVSSDNFDNNDEDADIYSVAAKYVIGGFFFGAANTSTNLEDADGDYRVSTVAAKYAFSGLSLEGLYQDEANETGMGSFEDVEIWSVATQYAFGDTSLRAMYTDQTVDDLDNDRIALGVQQKFGQGRVWLEYADVDNANGLKYSLHAADVISLGFRVDF